MRILHLASGRLFGGLERMLATLAAWNSAADGALDSWFAVCASGRAVDEIRAAGGRLECLGDVRVSRPRTVWRARARLRQLIQDTRIDVVICHAPWAYALFAATARRADTRVVWWQHDAATGIPWIERWARLTRADLVISNSRWTAQSAPTVQPGVPIEVVYCPVAPPNAASLSRRSLRAELDTGDTHVVVLSAARLEPWKGHRRLLRALAILQELQGWTLWIAGGPQRMHEARYLHALRQEAAALRLGDRVRWLGERRDIPSVMASADILCQPNLAPEPFGIVFAEALLSGLPVITTDLGGAPEIVDSQCGRLVAPADDAALASALRELIVDPTLRRRLAGAGAAHAASRCEPSIVLPRLTTALTALTTRVAA